MNEIDIDYLYEVEKDDRDIEKMEKASQNALKREFKCCVLCKEEFSGYGNNPEPLSNKGRCCDLCNVKVVAERIEEVLKREKKNEGDKK